MSSMIGNSGIIQRMKKNIKVARRIALRDITYLLATNDIMKKIKKTVPIKVANAKTIDTHPSRI